MSVTVLLLLSAFLFLQDSSATDSNVISVPGDYLTIQQAVNAANPGDTVFIRASVYEEHVNIDKTVYLIGSDPVSVIIDGKGVGNVVTVSANNVVVKGLSLRNSGSPFYAGLYISNAENVSVTNITVTNCSMGIRVDSSRDISVCDNEIFNNSYIGLRLWHYTTGTTVSGNVISNNPYGIGLFTYSSESNVSMNLITNNSIGLSLVNSEYNDVQMNNITDNSMYGIHLDDRLTANNTFSQNQISRNGYGAYVATKRVQMGNAFFHNNFINNSYFQVFIEPPYSQIRWNLHYPLGGNYWSDYNGTDLYSGPYQNITGSDGLGDKARFIAENNTDEYPLMQPFVGQKEPEGQASYSRYFLALILVVFVGFITFFVLRKQATRAKPEKPSDSEAPGQKKNGLQANGIPFYISLCRPLVYSASRPRSIFYSEPNLQNRHDAFETFLTCKKKSWRCLSKILRSRNDVHSS
jgi:parallel beta-helix repeat protein